MSRLGALVSYGGDESDDQRSASDAEESEAEASGSEVEIAGHRQPGTGDEDVPQGAAEVEPHAEQGPAEEPVEDGSGEGADAHGEYTATCPFSTAGIVLPKAPPGVCDHALQERVSVFMRKKEQGHHFNQKLRTNKEFQNPHICEKLVEHLGLDEFGSNCPKDIFNPYEFGEDYFYTNLAAKQRAWVEKKERERAMRTQIEFSSPGAGVQAAMGAATASVQVATARPSSQVGRNVTLPLPLPTAKRQKL